LEKFQKENEELKKRITELESKLNGKFTRGRYLEDKKDSRAPLNGQY